MNIIRINSRNVVFMIIALLSNTVRVAEMNYGGVANFGNNTSSIKNESNYNKCPVGKLCTELSGDCLTCDLPDKNNPNCTYGSMYTANCTVPLLVDCVGKKTFMKEYMCRYCYQTEHWEHKCFQRTSCSSISSPPVYYLTECVVNDDIICLGNRNFPKNVKCNWTSGYKWSTALILSITLGGFGADRFYLGHWQEGIGKLFSFGGLGVWTLIDVILISIRYLGPADGSLYI